MKVFAISNTSGSPWIHPPCNSGLAEMEKGPVVGRLSFMELQRSGMHVIVPALGTGLPSSSGEDWSGLHHHGVTLLAPQVVLHSNGPHLSSRALLHKAHHLPLQALLHSPALAPIPPGYGALLHPADHTGPEDISSNFLGERYIREIFKAFVALMPCK